MQPESLFKIKVLNRLAKLPKSRFFKIQSVSVRGIPDILGVVNGRFVALELKVGKNKADALQELTLHLLREAGGFARVVTPDNLDETLDLLTRLSED